MNTLSRSTGIPRFALRTLAASMMLVFGTQAMALPVNGVVTAGDAGINQGAGSTTITQTSQNTAINWQSFNIGQGESVRFIQPNSNSVALNRVLGSDPSSILGSLLANGKVFLINPNGILFGLGAQVNVSGLIASTLNLGDNDFMAGRYHFAGNSSATVIHQGTINADGGYVALLGANVSNNGTIVARLGTIALAAGNAMTLDVAGDGLLNVTVNQGAVNALAANGGLIQADGGYVLLTAKEAGTLLQSAVNNTGVIQAQSIDNRNGTIMLMGDMQIGTVNVGGTLDASAPNGGDGGFIETSAAHVKVADNAIINARSAQGQPGTWLIDPVDFTIANIDGDMTPAALAVALAANVTISSNDGGSGVNGDINVNNDVVWGAATTLTLNAVRNVNLNANITATTGSLVLVAGTDIIANAMAGTGIRVTDGNMTWTAGGHITVNPGVVGGIVATRGNILWTAGSDTTIGSAVTATDGNFTVCCGRDIAVNAVVTTTDGNVSLVAGRDIVITSNMTTTRGNVLLRAGPDATGIGGPLGGTVFFGPGVLYTVTAPGTAITIDYTPNSYADPLTNYSGNFIGTASTFLTTHMLVFAQGNNKVYDGNTTASLSFRGTPTLGGDVTLIPGTGNFDTKDVGDGKLITYTGYSLGGADAAKFALWASCSAVAGSGTTTANITPAPLTLQANDNTKVYGQTFTPASTAFTIPVAPVGAETVTNVTETSTGSAPTASVAGSTYPIVITPGSAIGANGFIPSNYLITYLPGALTVTPLAITGSITAADKVFDSTTSAIITGRTLAGNLVGDDVSYTGGSATFDTPVAGVGKTVTGTGLGLSGTDAGNYTVNPIAATTAAITPIIVIPPVVVPPPIESTPIAALEPIPEEMLGVEGGITPTATLGFVPAPMPRVVLAGLPPQLLTVAPIIVPVVREPAPLPPAAAPAETPPVYAPPLRLRKQDRN